MAQMLLNKVPFLNKAISVTTFNYVFDTEDILALSIETHTTGTPTGTYTFWRSNLPSCDPVLGQAPAAASPDWVAFTPAGVPANPAGAGANNIFELQQPATRFYKIALQITGGAGNYTLAVFGKGMG